MWDKRTKQCISELERHTDWVNRLIQINNNNIVSCYGDDKIRIWDIKKNHQLRY